MIGRKEIFQAVAEQIRQRVPDAEHYFGKLMEGYQPPAFLYLTTYYANDRHNACFTETELEIQVVYFGKTDRYGTTDFDEKIELEERVKEFLNKYILPVGDRHLLFSYETKEVDGLLSFYIRMKFQQEEPFEQIKKSEEETLAETVVFKERVK